MRWITGLAPDGTRTVVDSNTGEMIAHMFGSEPQVWERARLITLAPELLDAAEALLNANVGNAGARAKDLQDVISRIRRGL